VTELSEADQPVTKVVTATGDVVLTGTEDYLLVDMASAIRDVFVLLPSPGAMERPVTISVVAPGKKSLFVKGSDTGSVTINGKAQVQVTTTVKVVPTPTTYYAI
jgi:hypothetical protein